ncbi:YDG/SRA domain-containing protein [Actinoplanes sp. L3-i22]|uniref:YDG/SRA domain-containing protein n=1 Tax=Actinoplanes sp. L3-i22 TaxID=2836373 RepID=UPI001C742FBC|nr:YDG/SRA domain-containing protein [Actinoplanes sp. L3-i22]BCY06328.1 hypothetical protein L3i22_014160 [Actinoplanes sp. L3-i22]
MNLEEIKAELRKIRPGQSHGRPAVHQPFVLIWGAQRAVSGQSRQAKWSDVRSALSAAISELDGSAHPDVAALPVFTLRNSRLWAIEQAASASSARSAHAARWLNATNPLVGLSPEAFSALGETAAFEEFAHAAVDKLDETSARSLLDYFSVEMPLFRGFGEVPGVNVGSLFTNRADLHKQRVHRALQAGIVGTGASGAESIVVSGGYEDKDFGDWIIYTGHGGRDADSKRQIADQSPTTSGNAALITSHLDHAPVRVIRGAHDSPHAPTSGLRYDGLYLVEKFWSEIGRDGFRLCRYRLVRLQPTVAVTDGVDVQPPVLPEGTISPGRRTTVSERVIRSVGVASATKVLHNHTCQVCDTRLVVQGRGYAEGAHIRPLGEPHRGADTPANMLCLCPNCHVLFDNGAISIDDDLTIQSDHPHRGALREAEGHAIDRAALRYHSNIYPIK